MTTEWLDPGEQGASIQEQVLVRRHEAAYVLAAEEIDDGLVIDVPCGVGYSASLLRKQIDRYFGMDSSTTAVRKASRYIGVSDNVHFAVGNALGAIPVRSGAAATVLCFQLIEHVEPERAPTLLEELHRVTAPGGTIMITTPNRETRLFGSQRPWNRYHEKEYRPREFEEILRSVFDSVAIFGLRASDAVEEIEKERVRKKALGGLTDRYTSMLPKAIRAWFKKAGALLTGRAPGGKGGEAGDSVERTEISVGVEEFYLSSDEVSEAIDLVGICRL